MMQNERRSSTAMAGLAALLLAASISPVLLGCAGASAATSEPSAKTAQEQAEGTKKDAAAAPTDAKAPAGKGSDATDGKGSAGTKAADVAEEAGKVKPTPGGVVYPGGDTTGVLAAAADWTMTDQYGKEHSLADYRGKVVFLNFWTTWCPYCVTEMPDIQALYEDYGLNEGDVVILGVGNPATDDHPNNSDVAQDEVVKFLEENGVTYPVLMDTTSEVFDAYKVFYLPTTYMIDPYGNVFGSVSGGLDRPTMDKMVEQTLAGELKK